MKDFTQILGTSFFIGLIFLVIGAIMYYFPPKKINHFYGYRTASSMRSIESWNFAQRFSAVRMMIIGVFLMAASFIIYYLELTSQTEVTLEICVIFAAIIYLFIATERAIKRNFPK